MKYDIYESLGIFATILAVALLFSLILSLSVMWLWNSTLPELFGFKTIDWWMAWKLAALVSFLSPIRASSKN